MSGPRQMTPEEENLFRTMQYRQAQVAAWLELQLGRPYTCPLCQSEDWYFWGVTRTQPESLNDEIPPAGQRVGHVVCRRCHHVEQFIMTSIRL